MEEATTKDKTSSTRWMELRIPYSILNRPPAFPATRVIGYTQFELYAAVRSRRRANSLV